MHHSTFLGHMASIYRPHTYVELGLYEGETLACVAPYATEVHGVDMRMHPSLVNRYPASSVTLHEMKTDDFFATAFPIDRGIDMAFIDADHCFESAYRDFQQVWLRLRPGGIVFLHDTDPESDQWIDPGYCGDSYRLVPILEARDDLNVITLPLTNAGLTMITRKADTRTARRLAQHRIL